MTIHDKFHSHSEGQFSEPRDSMVPGYNRTRRPNNWFPSRLENWRCARHNASDTWQTRPAHLWHDDTGRLVGFCISESGERDLHLRLLSDSAPSDVQMIHGVDQARARDNERIEIKVHASQTARRDVLMRTGSEHGGPNGIMRACDLARPYPPVAFPPGYRVETQAENGEHDEHIAVERLTFGDDYLDRAWFHGKASAPGSAHDRDSCTVSPEGRHVAFLLGWIDAASHVAEMASVRRPPDHRRRGFTKAVVSARFRDLARRGVRSAYIASAAGPNTSKRRYKSLGPVERQGVQRWLRSCPCQ